MKDNKTIIACIPARYNSTRLPKKALAVVNDKPLIQHTYENAKECNILDNIIVVTDHEEIFSLVNSFGRALMTPENCKNGTERIAYAIQNHKDLQKADIILNIQGDHPFVSSKTIESIVDILLKDDTACVSTAVCKSSSLEDYKNKNIVKCVFDNNQNALYFSRAPIPFIKSENNLYFYHHIGIYAYRKDFLLQYLNLNNTLLQESEDLEQLKVLETGYKIKIAIVEEKTLGIDTLKDLKEMEKCLCR